MIMSAIGNTRPCLRMGKSSALQHESAVMHCSIKHAAIELSIHTSDRTWLLLLLRNPARVFSGHG
jgi:hypothetical protein